MRNKRWIWMAPLAILAIPVFIFIGGQLVMHLWNWLLPPLFGVPAVTFWQALGILALCRILFGGFGDPTRDRAEPRRGRAERWQRLSPEEQEQLRQSASGLASTGVASKGQ